LLHRASVEDAWSLVLHRDHLSNGDDFPQRWIAFDRCIACATMQRMHAIHRDATHACDARAMMHAIGCIIDIMIACKE